MALHCIKKDKSKQKILLVREKKRYALKRGADQGEIGKGKKKRIKPEREREIRGLLPLDPKRGLAWA